MFSLFYYIPGYQSTPQSAKATLFKKTFHATAIAYRDGRPEDIVISECLNRISNTIKNDTDVILIGSSLGGFLAASTALTHSTVTRLVLLNPAIIPPQTNLDTIQDIPRSILEDMRDARLFTQKISAPVIILRGTEDEVVPDQWVLAFAQAQEATIRFLHDDHRFSKNLTVLPAIISKLLHQ